MPEARFDSARLSVSGSRRVKLLVIGDEIAVAPGRAGDRDLAAAIVEAGREQATGLDVDVLWNLLPALSAVVASPSWRVWRYDAVVVVAGGGAGGLGTARLKRMLVRLAAEAEGAGRIVVVLATPGSRDQSGRTARRRSASLQQAVEFEDEVTVVPAALDDETGTLADPDELAAEVLAACASGAPGEAESAGTRRDAPQDEPLRQVAVDRSLQAIEGSTTDLQRAVLLARNSFGVPFAQVNLVSRGRLRSLAFAGRSSDDLEHTLSALAVQQDGPLLIPDTHEDRRCFAIPEVRGPEAIRFYAGYPIESMDGYRIGVICVLDTEPHPIADGDDVLLRDIALLAEAELNALTARR